MANNTIGPKPRKSYYFKRASSVARAAASKTYRGSKAVKARIERARNDYDDYQDRRLSEAEARINAKLARQERILKLQEKKRKLNAKKRRLGYGGPRREPEVTYTVFNAIVPAGKKPKKPKSGMYKPFG